MSTRSQHRPTDDEIDLIPLLLALWRSKTLILVTTLSGAAVCYGIYKLSPEQWTASTYVTRASLYSLYEEFKDEDTSNPASLSVQGSGLYSSIQEDVFYTAMGVMTANNINLKETAPKTVRNATTVYIASAAATTKEQASNQLKLALDAANTQALKLNLPTLSPANGIRAFNTLGEIKTANSKHPKKSIMLGGVLGLILGSLFTLGRYLVQQHKKTTRP